MRYRYGLLVFGILAMTALCEGASPVIPTTTTKADAMKSAKWREKMQELYKVLVEMTTDTSSDRRFNDPKNKARIDKNTKKLVDRAHEMSKKGVSPDADPTVKILAGLFQDEAQRAHWALKSGNRTYARGILSQVSGVCIACHDRNHSGPSFSTLPLEPSAKDLSSVEQGRFFAATRQFDRALDVFQKTVDDPMAPILRPLEWEQAIHIGLAIAVRVKKDPDQARALVERVLGSPKAPYFLKQDAQKWKDSIIKWKEEPPRRAMTEEGLHSEAMQLIAQARELQKYPMDQSADILYLRASAVVHELLQTAPDGRYGQEALLMAGMCYDILRPLGLDDLHEIYYEACIRKTPHTPTAEICLQQYERSTYAGYTGSGGTVLPDDVQEKLKQLEELAHPVAPTPAGAPPTKVD